MGTAAHHATESSAKSSDPFATLTAWAQAYASRDSARIAANYAEDASLWGTASTSPTTGRPEIAAYFGRPREGVVSATVSFDEQNTQILGDGTALAFGRYTFRQTRADGTDTARPSRFSMVLTKGSDGLWRIAHHHSSPLPQKP